MESKYQHLEVVCAYEKLRIRTIVENNAKLEEIFGPT